jgi:L-asparagine transporter-like permease
MKKFFSRYTHWLTLAIIAFSFSSMFINFKLETPDIIAIILGGIGLFSIGYLTLVVERHIRKQNEEK